MPRGDETLSLTHEGRSSEAAAVEPFLFFILCSDRPLLPSSRHNLTKVDEVILGRGEEASATFEEEGAHRRLTIRSPDRRMSSAHARLSRVLDGWMLEDSQSKNGSFVNGQKRARAELKDGDVLELGHSYFIFRRSLPAPPLRAEPPALVDPAMATLLPAYAADLELAGQIAKSTLAVFLRGESGTGKEDLARALHALSGRTGQFIAVGSGALSDAMLEVELFGVEAGAFPGATEARPGFVRAADGGTLFLDEIGDLSPSAQAALLRALEAREIHPLGSSRAVEVDIRCIATTNRDVEALVSSGALRKDLLARLEGFTLRLPPLRERREDLGLLIASILKKAGGERADRLRLDTGAVRAMFAHDWPGNVRELDQVLRAALVVSKGDELKIENLGKPSPAATPVAMAAPTVAATAPDVVSESGLVLRPEGEYWTILYQGTVLRLADTHGLHYIAHLVANPGQEFHVLDLSALIRGEAPEPRELGGGPGPALDAEAKRAYKERISTLKSELDEAKRWNDRARAEKAQAELDFLAEELARGVGLGGRDRANASASERARANITARIRKVIKRIEEQSPPLAHHLSSCIKTGTFCSYSPAPKISRRSS